MDADTASVANSGYTDPGTLDLSAPSARLRVLTCDPDDGPVALCLCGFPDVLMDDALVAGHILDVIGTAR